MKMSHRKNATTRSPFVLLLLFLLVLIFLSPACVTTYERPIQSYEQQPPPHRSIDLRNIEGVLSITSNNYPGKLEFHRAGNRWAGRINFDPHQRWDELTDIFFDPRTGEIQFTRPTYGTRYSGTLSGNHFAGTFTERGLSYPWEASRELADLPRLVDLRMIQGLWHITSNSNPGKVEFYWARNRWAGRINFDPNQRWDELSDIFFNSRTGEIQFTRPTYGTRYSGTLSDGRFTGNFTERGLSYPWNAKRALAPRAIDLRLIQGFWNMTSNTYPGRLEFYSVGSHWAGRINFDPNLPWDELTDIHFDSRTGEIQFTRPTYGTKYSGTLSGNRFTGTFTERGLSYSWEAKRSR